MSGTISMETEFATQLASTLNQNAKMLDDLSGELSTRINRLEYHWLGGPARDAFFSESTQLKSRLRALTNDLFELSDRLTREIKEWQEADARFGAEKKPVNNTEVGRLFVRGAGDSTTIHPNDVFQGAIGDCYLMAAMAALAGTNPDLIREMITVNADGSYTVRFYNEQTNKAEYVTIREEDIPKSKGNLKYAGYGDDGELWPAILERAYAEWIDERNIRDPGWSRFLETFGLEGKDDYKLIDGGYPERALQHLTGATYIKYDNPVSFSKADLQTNLMKGNPIVLSTPPSLSTIFNPLYGGNEGQLVPSHAYYITGYDAATGLVEIRNPWGWTERQATVHLPLEVVQQNVGYIAVTNLTL